MKHNKFIIAIASLQLLLVGDAAAQSDPFFDFDLTPFAGSPTVDCANRPAGDPAPPADIVVSIGSPTPDLASAFTAAASPLADANLDGVISICVEPGSYSGSAGIDLRGKVAPVWVWSSQGATVTSMVGPGSGQPAVHFNDGLGGTLPPTTANWPVHALIRGFAISSYTSTAGTAAHFVCWERNGRQGLVV